MTSLSCDGQAQILLVAGPSGSGKSTFIEFLRAGRLPAEIRARLPDGCEGWREVGATRAWLEQGVPLDAWKEAARDTGLILHYDIVFIYRSGVGAYEDDAAVALFRLSDSPTIVSIKPDRDRLLAQFNGRQERALNAKPIASRVWRRYVRNPLRHVTRSLAGTSDTPDFYRDPAWLPACYSRWDTAVQELIRDKPRATVFSVAPQGDDADATFRLIETSEAA